MQTEGPQAPRPRKTELRELEIEPEDAGGTLKDVLVDRVIDLSTGAIHRLLKDALVMIGDEPCAGNRVVKAGEVYRFEVEEEAGVQLVPAPLDGFEVLYEDEACMVVAKPSGVGVTADRGSTDAPFLSACLHHLEAGSGEGRTPRPRVVHRLDKETSGAVVLAKSREALRSLTSQFTKRKVEKEYAALVHGVPHRVDGVIDLPIGYELRSNKLRAGGRDARPARTQYVVAERFRGYSLLHVMPLTGRQHQIRIHLEAVGHPLVVDKSYGDRQELLLSSFKKNYRPNRRRIERPLLDRLALHARRLKFESPATGETVEVVAEYPKDLAVTLKQLRKWAAPHRR